MMKPKKIILFDEVCPLCCWYTGWFQRCHWLEPGGRQPFREGMQEWQARLDPERARHEIPLIDRDGGPTLYGLDALLFLIGQHHPRMARLGHLPPVRQPLEQLYQFISYNRRVIAGSTGNPRPEDGAPAFHRGWRSAWLILAAGVIPAGVLLRALLANPAAHLMSLVWLAVLLAFGAATVRTWDGWGRWAGHAVLGTFLWTATSLRPGGLASGAAGAITAGLLFLDARRRCAPCPA